MKITALKQTLPAALQKSLELAPEKGASARLMTLPIEEHGFSLHKQAFRDTLCVCNGWEPTRLPSQCSWGSVHHNPCFQLFKESLPLNSTWSYPRCDSSTPFHVLCKCRGGTTSQTSHHCLFHRRVWSTSNDHVQEARIIDRSLL